MAGSPSSRPARKRTGPADPHALLVEAIRNRWNVFRLQVGRNRRRSTERSIHDLRVATRRLVAAIDMAATVLPRRILRSVRSRLRRHLRAFGELRDVQVQLTLINDMREEFPELREYRSWLLARERVLVAAAHTEAGRIQVTAIGKELSTASARLEELFRDPVMQDVARAATTGAMATAFARALRIRRELRNNKPSDIHRLRVAFKKCRYSTEILARALRGVDSVFLKSMNTYQTRMGQIQDNEVLASAIRNYSRARPGPGTGALMGVLQHLARRRRALVAEFSAHAGELEEFWREPPGPVGTTSRSVGENI